MNKGTYEVAIDAYITFRGEADSEEDFIDEIFDGFWEWLQEHPRAVTWETKKDYSRESFTRPPLSGNR